MKNNILIAEFMGWKRYEGFNFITPHTQNYMSTGAGMCDTHIFRESDLKFDTSWEWLMGVVDRIESLDLRGNGHDFPKVKIGNGVEIFCYANYRGTWYEWRDYYGIDGAFYKHKNQCETKKMAVYKVVIEFIEWFNQRDKSV